MECTTQKDQTCLHYKPHEITEIIVVNKLNSATCFTRKHCKGPFTSQCCCSGNAFLIIIQIPHCFFCFCFVFSDLQCNLHEDAMLAFVSDVYCTQHCFCIFMWIDVAAGYSPDLGFRTEKKKKTFPEIPHTRTQFPVISVSRLQPTSRHTYFCVFLSLRGKGVIVH